MRPNPEALYRCDRIRKHYTNPTKSGSIIRIRPYPDPLASYGSAFFIRIRLNSKAAWIIWIRPYPEASYGSESLIRIRNHHQDPTVSEFATIIRIRICKHHSDPTVSEFATIIRIRPNPNSNSSSGFKRLLGSATLVFYSFSVKSFTCACSVCKVHKPSEVKDHGMPHSLKKKKKKLKIAVQNLIT